MTAAGSRSLELEQDVRSVRTARSFVHSHCAEAGLPASLCELAALLTSETVTNAFVHGGSDATLTVGVDSAGVLVQVTDANPRAPTVGRLDDFEALGGRGLAILDKLATAWGTRPVRGGKVVWFRLDAS